MKNPETIISTDKEVEELKDVNTISSLNSKNGCYYTVRFFDGSESVFFVKTITNTQS